MVGWQVNILHNNIGIYRKHVLVWSSGSFMILLLSHDIQWLVGWQVNNLHNNVNICRNHVLMWEQWFIYGAAIVSGYIAASRMAGEFSAQ
jgi:hypothetical protein